MRDSALRVFAALTMTSVQLACCTRAPAPAGAGAEATPGAHGSGKSPGTPRVVGVSDARSGAPYDIGSPVVRDIWVDPSRGADANDGGSESRPLRTISAAWSKIPEGQVLSGTGYRINLLPGTYPCEPGPEDSNCINFFGKRWGTYQFPIILQAARGSGSAVLRGGLNLDDIRYVYIIGISAVGGAPLPTNSSGNNLVHIANAEHVLLRGVTLKGPSCVADSCNNLQEVLKVNQAQHVYVEGCTMGGAWHSTVDWMVVQHGHVMGSYLYGAGQWCMYAKGGSAYLRISGNELEGCQLGFQAGQAANLAMMRPPWIHHEVYDVKFVGNLLHDIAGVPLSVAGGYNVLFAHNTLVRVATSSQGYPLFQVVRGERNCTPTDEVPNPVPACQKMLGEGGWGPGYQTESGAVIPARNVWVYNNIFLNPAPLRTAYSHFQVDGPIPVPDGYRNLPSPVATDTHLVLAGNVVWNGPKGHPLGFEEASAGCQPNNPTCNAAVVMSQNAINTIEPQLTNPDAGDFRPLAGGNVAGMNARPILDFSWADCPARPSVPPGNLSNLVFYGPDGRPRSAANRPGAW